jgi:hypothetical protein
MLLDQVSADVPLHLRAISSTIFGTAKERALSKLSRSRLQKISTWSLWQQAEWKGLDDMYNRNMYGKPVKLPPGAVLLRPLWTYSFRNTGERKARNCCNGSPRAAPNLKWEQTYASCIDQPSMRIFYALSAALGMTVMMGDVTNAYAHSPPPSQPTYVRIDDQYAEWYQAKFHISIDRSMVLPVRHALQGHPESGSLWEKMINEVLSHPSLAFCSTTHERNIYRGSYKGQTILLCKQVDDFTLAAPHPDLTH